jgi:hypothetical protein
MKKPPDYIQTGLKFIVICVAIGLVVSLIILRFASAGNGSAEATSNTTTSAVDTQTIDESTGTNILSPDDIPAAEPELGNQAQPPAATEAPDYSSADQPQTPGSPDQGDNPRQGDNVRQNLAREQASLALQPLPDLSPDEIAIDHESSAGCPTLDGLLATLQAMERHDTFASVVAKYGCRRIPPDTQVRVIQVPDQQDYILIRTPDEVFSGQLFVYRAGYQKAN